jgi:hypothetical protein
MNDMPGIEAVAFGDFRRTGFATAQRAALSQQLRARRAMNRAIHSAAAKQRIVRGVDNRIHGKGSDIASKYLDLVGSSGHRFTPVSHASFRTYSLIL